MRWLKTYSFITRTAGWIALPLLKVVTKVADSKGELRSRLDLQAQDHYQLQDTEVWIHGASVGEMEALWAIVSRLLTMRPDTKLVISAFTTPGVRHAQRLSKGNIPVIQFPLDLPQVVEKITSQLSPKVFCTIETEIWPNLLLTLKGKGAALLLLNGRISDRSFPSYMRARFLFGEALRLFDGICAITELDKKRLASIGAMADSISVCGNAKYESLLGKPNPEAAAKLREKLGLSHTRPVIVAGSIREKEYQMVYHAVKEISRLRPLTILVPRHIERVEEIEKFLRSKGAKMARVGELKGQAAHVDFILVDQMGWLFNLYAVCDIAFVGGSMVPLGGQNVMEPASWGKPVVFGPHTENFKEATSALLEAKGGFMASGPEKLGRIFESLLSDEDTRILAGQKARNVLRTMGQGAATSQAELIVKFLG